MCRMFSCSGFRPIVGFHAVDFLAHRVQVALRKLLVKWSNSISIFDQLERNFENPREFFV